MTTSSLELICRNNTVYCEQRIWNFNSIVVTEREEQSLAGTGIRDSVGILNTDLPTIEERST